MTAQRGLTLHQILAASTATVRVPRATKQFREEFTVVPTQSVRFARSERKDLQQQVILALRRLGVAIRPHVRTEVTLKDGQRLPAIVVRGRVPKLTSLAGIGSNAANVDYVWEFDNDRKDRFLLTFVPRRAQRRGQPPLDLSAPQPLLECVRSAVGNRSWLAGVARQLAGSHGWRLGGELFANCPQCSRALHWVDWQADDKCAAREGLLAFCANHGFPDLEGHESLRKLIRARQGLDGALAAQAPSQGERRVYAFDLVEGANRSAVYVGETSKTASARYREHKNLVRPFRALKTGRAQAVGLRSDVPVLETMRGKRASLAGEHFVASLYAHRGYQVRGDGAR